MICCKRQSYSKRMRTLIFLHTLQWSFDLLGRNTDVFASFCTNVLQAPNVFEKGACH